MLSGEATPVCQTMPMPGKKRRHRGLGPCYIISRGDPRGAVARRFGPGRKLRMDEARATKRRAQHGNMRSFSRDDYDLAGNSAGEKFAARLSDVSREKTLMAGGERCWAKLMVGKSRESGDSSMPRCSSQRPRWLWQGLERPMILESMKQQSIRVSSALRADLWLVPSPPLENSALIKVE